MTELQSREHDRRSLLTLELALWMAVVFIALISAFTGFTGGGVRGSQEEYMWGYVALSLAFYPILTTILLVHVRARLKGVEFRLLSLAMPAFLIAALLHIGSWGVSASRWLVNIQPGIGAALWTFIIIAMPMTLAICALSVVKLRMAGHWRTGSASKTRSKRGGSGEKLRGVWFAILSIVFLLLFVLTAAGAYLTAIDVRGHWFGEEMTALTHYVVLYSYFLLTIALLAPSLMTHKGSRPSSRRVVLGPMLVGAILSVTSLYSLLSPDLMLSDFRLNTGVVLFVAYGASLLPSYVIVCALRLINNIKEKNAQKAEVFYSDTTLSSRLGDGGSSP